MTGRQSLQKTLFLQSDALGDLTEANSWYRRAADLGYEPAMAVLRNKQKGGELGAGELHQLSADTPNPGDISNRARPKKRKRRKRKSRS
jgi:TPR repeat protein